MIPKRLPLFIIVIMTAIAAFAGSGGNSTGSADAAPSQMQRSKAGSPSMAGLPAEAGTPSEAEAASPVETPSPAGVSSPAAGPSQVQQPTFPSLSEKWQGRMEKINQKLEKKQQRSAVKDGKKLHHADVWSLLVIGLVLILVGILLWVVPGLGVLGSLCATIGAILCIVALIVYLVSYA